MVGAVEEKESWRRRRRPRFMGIGKGKTRSGIERRKKGGREEVGEAKIY